MYQPQEGTTGFWGLRLEPCDCQCHQPGVIIIHFMPCCENGFRESNKLEIVNPDKILPWIHDYSPGDIFDLPDGYGFEVAYHCDACKQAELKSLKLIKLNSAHSFIEQELPFSFLEGRMIRYRYIDWEPGSYTVWAKCTVRDLKKFDDKSIESIEFKP